MYTEISKPRTTMVMSLDHTKSRVNTTCPKAACGGYMTAFMATLYGLIDEEHVTKSECGPSIVELISSLRECSHHDNTRDLVVKLCESIQSGINGASFPWPLLEKSGLHFMNFILVTKSTSTCIHNESISSGQEGFCYYIADKFRQTSIIYD